MESINLFKKIANKVVPLLLIFASLLSCNRSEFLDANPDQRLIVPETIEELQSLLDNIYVMNGIGAGVVPSFGEIGSDNYYAIDFIPLPVGESLKKIYSWQEPKDPNIKFVEWDLPYRVIFYANIVLEGLGKISKDSRNKEAIDNLFGSALFFRAEAFFQLSQVFAPSYNNSTDIAGLGIPLKLTSKVDERLERSSVKETYARIIEDFRTSLVYLPISPKYRTRPSKPATLAALARTFLTMKAYDSSWYYANECLKIQNSLTDFNDEAFVNKDGFPGLRGRFNPEVIFQNNIITETVNPLMYNDFYIRVDTSLYNSYDENDLRKAVFFNEVPPGHGFKGSYDASSTLFSGTAVDEMYLIRAECFVRMNDKEKALKDLNQLMEKRWRSGLFVPITASNNQEALEKILVERRKELIFRGLRWSDLRRLNEEGANITLSRIVDGQIYTLPPNDKRYTFLIPNDVAAFNPNWQQNPR